MSRKKQEKLDPNDGMPILDLANVALREAIVEVRSQIQSGDVKPNVLQALASVIRSLQRDSSSDPADLDRRVRELDATERQNLMQGWLRMDDKRSGLA